MAHLAPSLVRLRDEVNATWPQRSKASDGWIGDAAHAARASDHNPDGSGRVHAIDVTVSGIDKARLIARALADPRTSYVISDRRIWENPAAFPGRGYWRVYTGANPHTAHVHISTRRGSWAASTASWGVSTATTVGGPIIILPPVLPGDPGPVAPTPTPDPISPAPTPKPTPDPIKEIDMTARQFLLRDSGDGTTARPGGAIAEVDLDTGKFVVFKDGEEFTVVTDLARKSPVSAPLPGPVAIGARGWDVTRAWCARVREHLA